MSVPDPSAFNAALEQMAAMGAAGLKLPPPVFVEMRAEPRDYQPGNATGRGATLRVRFPVLEKWQNPMGHMHGGAIAMAMDNVIGPLSYMAAPPSATTEMNLTYLRPVPEDVEYIEVEARVVIVSGRSLVFDAEMTLPDGTVAALARATNVIVRR